MKQTVYLFLLIGMSPLYLKAQISGDCTYPYTTPEGLVEIIVGEGVDYSNVTFSGFDCSVGYFSGPSNIGFSQGLVMATGGIGSISPGSTGYYGAGGGTDNDLSDQLEILNSSSTSLNNLIVLEFDFIPSSNQVSFQYVFASNEYANYTCSQYNDIFGLFLSGPGISGPFTNNGINLAVVPDPNNPGGFTDTPVGINTINSGVASGIYSGPCDVIDPNWQDYSVFFTDNSNEETVSFPGFTVPLTATSAVISGESYHIKIAIADVMDGALNSAIFLEGMLSSETFDACTDVAACNYTENEACIYPGETEFIDYVADYFDLNQVEVEYNGEVYPVLVQETDVLVDGFTVFSQGTNLYLQGSNLFTQGTSLFFYGVSEIWDVLTNEIYSILLAYDSDNTFDCDGCLNDVDANNICDEFQAGCPLPEFLEYNPIALTFDYTLCQTYIVYGCVNPDALNFNIEANVSDGTCEYENNPCPSSVFGEALYLPDGSGVTYSTSISIDCYGNTHTLTDVNDIVSIDINMEHSYTGDLDIFITAPNGMQVQLFAQAGGSTWLGEATDQDATATNPGVGYDYGWSMNSTYNGTMYDGMTNGNTTSVSSPNGMTGNSLNSDIYLPFESLEALLGTPLNGTWTLTVVDNLGIDNGWIFSWGITLFNDGFGCTDPSALNYNSNASEDDGSCEYETCSLPDYWTSINTGANQTIMIPADILINGENIPNGTQLGLFYMDDFGAYQSAGSVAYYGDVIAIPTMADDSTTPEMDGLIEGADLIWALWNYSTCEDMLLSATYSGGPDVFTTNGITFVESFSSVPTVVCQTINFPAGWFIFSTYIESDIVDMEALFAPIVASIVIVKNNAGMAYLPEWEYNGIGDINNAEGFQVKTYNAVSFEICGMQISPEINPLSLVSGWNLISYTREEPADVVSIVASLVANDNLVIVKDNDGMAYLPVWDYNGIGDMIATQGYQLKINQDAVLEFLSNSETYE